MQPSKPLSLRLLISKMWIIMELYLLVYWEDYMVYYIENIMNTQWLLVALIRGFTGAPKVWLRNV